MEGSLHSSDSAQTKCVAAGATQGTSLVRGTLAPISYAMKKCILKTFLFIGLTCNLYSQELYGTYYHNFDTIEFSSEFAEFTIESDGCLTYTLKGCGSYEIFQNFLLIYTKEYTGQKSGYFLSESKADSAILTVTDMDGEIIPGVTVVYLDNNGNIVGGTVIDKRGYTVLPRRTDIVKFNVAFVGFEQLTLEYTQNTNYSVSLYPGKILEYVTIAFKIDSIRENSFTLILLTTDFKSTPNNKLKDLKKLEKRAIRTNTPDRVFII